MRRSMTASPPSLLRRQIRIGAPSSASLAALFGYLCMGVFLFRDAVLGGRVLFRRDISTVWLPQVETLVRCVAAGSWPLWDPYSGFGRPLLADPRPEVLYPLTWLNLILSPGPYLTLFTLFHLVGSAWGMFALARRWGLSALASFVAGAVWMGSGPLLSLPSLWHHLAAAGWMPWVFLSGERALVSRSPVPALLWGAAIAAQVFAGSPEISALTLAAFAVHALAHLVPRPWRWSSTLPVFGSAAVGLAFAAALSALQWLPTLELASRSGRTGLSYASRTSWSLHPWALLEVVLPVRWAEHPLQPHLLGTILEWREPWLHSIYLGLPSLALVTGAFLARRPRRNLLLVLLVASVTFALGKHAYVYDVATVLVPPLKMLRFPVKTMVLAAFAWSLLAAMGLDAFREAAGGDRWRRALRAAPLAVAWLIAVLAAVAGLQAARWAPALLAPATDTSYATAFAPAVVALGVGVAGLTGALALLRTRRTRALPALAAGLAVVDLLLVHRNLHPTAPPELYKERPEVLEALDGERSRLYVYDYLMPTRAQVLAGRNRTPVYRLARVPQGWSTPESLVLGVHMYLNPPTAARWGLRGSYDFDILDFEPEPRFRLTELLRDVEDGPAHLRLLQMGGVTHVLALDPAPWWQDLERVRTVQGLFEKPIQVFTVPGTLPRTYVVGTARVMDDKEALKAVAGPDFDPRREVLLDHGVPAAGGPEAPGSSRILESRPDRVSLQADLDAPGYVVLLDGFDEGWRARVDGVDAEVLKANIAFRAVRVPAGRHVIEYVYRPRTLAWGGALTAAALLLGGGWAVWRARRALPGRTDAASPAGGPAPPPVAVPEATAGGLSRRETVLLVALALAARLAHLAQIAPTPMFELHRTFPESDMYMFDQWAQRIVAGDVLGREVHHPLMGWQLALAPVERWAQWYGTSPVFYKAPFYPYLVAALRVVFGAPMLPLAVLQIAASAAAVGLLAHLCAQLLGRMPGLLAGLLLATYGPAIHFDVVMLRGPWIVLTSLLVCRQLVSLRARPGPPAAAGLGLFTALALLVNEGFLVLPPLLLLYMAIALRGVRGGWTRAGGFLLGLGAGLLPVVLRNVWVGAPPWKLAVTGSTVYAVFNSGQSSPYFFEVPSSLSVMEAGGDSLLATMAACLRSFAGPLDVVLFYAQKAVGLVVPFENPDNFNFYYARLRDPLLAVSPGYEWLFPLTVLGLGLGWPRIRRLAPLVPVALSLLASMLLTLPLSRYRVVFAVYLIPLAALALDGLLRLVRRRAVLPVLSAAGVVAVAALVAGRLQAGTVFAGGSAAKHMYRHQEFLLGADGRVREGRYAEARRELLQLIQLNPEPTPRINALVALARLEAGRGNGAAAREALEAALGLGGEEPGLLILAGDLHVELLQDLTRASELYARAAAADAAGRHAKALGQRGHAPRPAPE
jgi:hypothetical protein